MHILRGVIVALVCLAGGAYGQGEAAPEARQTEAYAALLAALDNPPAGRFRWPWQPTREEAGEARKLRFLFLLGEFGRLCGLRSNESADWVAMVQGRVQDAGIADGYLETADAMHRMALAHEMVTVGCGASWLTYIALRIGGLSAEDAVADVVAAALGHRKE